MDYRLVYSFKHCCFVRCNDADTEAIVLVWLVCMYYSFATKIFISLHNNGDLSSKWLTKRKSEFLVLPVNLFGKIELKLVFRIWTTFMINVLWLSHILYYKVQFSMTDSPSITQYLPYVPPIFTYKNSAFWPRSFFMCFLWFSK